MMKKRMLAELLVLFMVACLAGCGGNRTTQTSAPQEQQKEARKNEAESKAAAMTISTAQGDPFLTLVYADMEQPGKEYGIKAKIIEAPDEPEYNEQIRAMAGAGANPIYVVRGDLATEAIKITPDFSDTKSIVMDYYVINDLGSVKTIVVEPQEAVLIAGVVAVKTSESKWVSWTGSADQSVINEFHAGSEAGVAYTNPSVERGPLYIGDASNPNKGGELTKQVIGKGTDVVTYFTNKTGLSVIRACGGEGVKAIGVDEWRGAINEDIVFWSAFKGITGAVYHVGRGALNNIFTAGADVYNISSGLKFYDSRNYAELPDNTRKEVDGTVERTKSGEAEIPSDVK